MGRENFMRGPSKKKYTIIADTTTATASRDIAESIEKECIKQVDGTTGKNTRYKIMLTSLFSS